MPRENPRGYFGVHESWGVLPRYSSDRRGFIVLVEVVVQSLGLDRSANTPVVILQEVGGPRVLPIWIGPSEASSIAMQLAEMEFERPLTHDLLVSVLQGLGGELSKVIISKVEEGTYFAELVVRRNGDLISVDARPSDSIAVALRTGAKIFAQDSLLDVTAIEAAEDDSHGVSESPMRASEGSQAMGPAELEEHLRRLDPEDFGRFKP
ncbi:MAG: bifunctional nuclease family protein [Gemmatimonadota bacterium]|nr:bifunctional nuclease family protein [Gemmatimonadota bacterium]